MHVWAPAAFVLFVPLQNVLQHDLLRLRRIRQHLNLEDQEHLYSYFYLMTRGAAEHSTPFSLRPIALCEL